MTHEIDEVRLTAYALGELDAAEAAEFEALLASNAEARREVDAIRAFGGRLAVELAAEPAVPLGDSRRAAITAASRGSSRWSWRRWTVAAASVLLVASLATAVWRNKLDCDERERAAVLEVAVARAAAADPAKPHELDFTYKGPPPQPDSVKESDDDLYSAYFTTLGRRLGEKSLGLPEDAIFVGSLQGSRFSEHFDGVAIQMSDNVPRERIDPDGWKLQDDADSRSVESYSAFKENPFVRAVGDDARSTFALDVDTASYSNVRRFLRSGRLPDKGAVRIEELVNYFDYDYPAPKDGKPLAVSVEVGACPWAPAHRLALIGLKAKTIAQGERPKANLVFLIDVSASMDEPAKLPLVKKALRLLLTRLGHSDKVSLVVYAGTSGLVLPPTSAGERRIVEDAIERLEAGGSTNGAQGIELAYQVAKDAFIPGGINRVILCTDGDFNVGVTSEAALVELIEAKAKTGVFLTALGFGMGNLKDSTIQKLADKGNGNYGYVDCEQEAKKLLVDQVDGTLVTVAKDARIQVEVNPARAGAWRLIGYEKRVMPNRDFHDDTKDAGEVGAGHTVTALYEIIPAGSPELDKLAKSDPPRYQASATAGAGQASAELMTVALRWKPADGDVSTLSETPVRDDPSPSASPSRNLRFAAAVAMFGMELRGSEHKGLTNWALIDELARESKGDDARGLRAEFLELIGLAKGLAEPKK